METVRITRRFVARDGNLVDALSSAGWDALMARVDAVAPISVVPLTTAHGEHVEVTVADQRGPTGAYALHDLACRYGAPAVCL